MITVYEFYDLMRAIDPLVRDSLAEIDLRNIIGQIGDAYADRQSDQDWLTGSMLLRMFAGEEWIYEWGVAQPGVVDSYDHLAAGVLSLLKEKGE